MAIDYGGALPDPQTDNALRTVAGHFPIKTQDLANGAVTTAKTSAGPSQNGASLGTGSFDGQLAYYVADATNGVIWTFRWRSAAAANKWEFVGGQALVSEVTTQENSTAANLNLYGALATAGPTVTVPLAGDYLVRIGCGMFHSVATNNIFMSYGIGGTGAVDADAHEGLNVAASQLSAYGSRSRRKTGLAAATALTAKYKTSATVTGTWKNRWMEVLPIRVT